MAYGEYLGVKKPKYFLKYLYARIRQDRKIEAYRNYIADSLYWGNQNGHLTIKYNDLLKKTNANAKRDNRTGDEVAKDVVERLGLKLK